MQAREAELRGVAGDQGGIDGSDGDAGDPVGLGAYRVQGFIDAGLIGSQRAAALQNEDTEAAW